MVNDDLKLSFEQNGFLHFEHFFAPELMDELDQLIFEHFGEKPEYAHDEAFIKGAHTEIVPWFPQREGVTAFDKVENDERFKELTEALLGPGWGSQYCMTMFSKAGTSGQAWHQDCPPEDKTRFNLNRLVYTTDIVPEIGGQIAVCPGTHKECLLTTGEAHEELDNQLVIAPKKGDLILLHGHCWHRVLPVVSKWRFSTNYRAAPAGTPDDITDVCVYRNMRYRFSTSEIIEDRLVTA